MEIVPLLAAGKTYTTIAGELGVTRETVGRWADRPEVVTALRDLQGDVQEAVKRTIVAASVDAIALLHGQVIGRNPATGCKWTIPHHIRRQAADSLLDRAGHRGKVEVEVNGSVDVAVSRKPDEDLERIVQEAARDIATRVVIDAAPAEEEPG